MKLPEDLNLPWKNINNISVEDSNSRDVIPDAYGINDDDIDYICLAANNFPEAVRLLKELEVVTATFGLDRANLGIKSFLTKLEEDENIK